MYQWRHRKCQYRVDFSDVEDEKHFTLDCTRYKSLRDDLFYSLGTETIEHAPNSLSLLLNPPVCHSSTIAKFIYQCLEIRKLTATLSSPPHNTTVDKLPPGGVT
jgi:hypothetical protein